MVERSVVVLLSGYPVALQLESAYGTDQVRSCIAFGLIARFVVGICF
jgi:hypothetical protein